jgi:hypothetical protein
VRKTVFNPPPPQSVKSPQVKTVLLPRTSVKRLR